MYNAKINSPLTTLSSDINSIATTIPVTDISVFPNAPNLATIGTGNNAETILYTDKSGSSLVGVTRGFQGTAQTWSSGTIIGRLFTAYDHDSLKSNVEDVYGYPFQIKSAEYNSVTDTLSIIITSGSGESFNSTTLNTITKTSDTTFNINPVSASVTYNIYLKNDGNFDKSTNGSIPNGSILIGTISTNADKSINTITDKRPLVSAVGSEFIKHLTDTIIDANKTITVGSTGCDFTTIPNALDSIKTASITSSTTVTISLLTEMYEHTSQLKINHINGSNIIIQGATPITTTVSSVGGVSGTTGSWSVPITVASAVGMQVGQYAIIKNTTGTGNHEVLRGMYEITNINGNVVTVKNTYQGTPFPAVVLTGGDFIVLTTTLKFTNCNGIVADRSELGLLNNVAIVGSNASTNYGILSTTGASITCGTNVGVSGFKSGFFVTNRAGITAPYTASSNNENGYECSNFAGIYINNCIANGNSEKGAYDSTGGGMMAENICVCGNKSGLTVNNGGKGFSSGIIAKNNVEYNIDVCDEGALFASDSNVSDAGLIDIFAYNNGYVRCSNYSGSPIFSPEPNSEGNKGSWIIT